jgi:hypothetical protein
MASSTLAADSSSSSRHARLAFGFSGRVAGLTVGLLVASAMCPADVMAQTSDDALAESLFQEGKRLMDAGQLDAACPKLAESHRLAPAGGTAIAVGMCFEKAGKSASAWAAFTDALSIANRDKRTDRATFATARLGELDLQLARVAVTVPIKVRTLPNVTITLDGRPLNKAAWDTRTPIDPGTHQLTASADGHRTAEAPFSIKAGETLAVETPIPIPDPEKAHAKPATTSAPAAVTSTSPAPPPPPASSPSSTDVLHPTRGVGLVVAGVGVVALAVGGAFGLSALDKTKEANDRCPTSRCGDAGAVDLNDKAGTHATLATALVPVGAVALAVGTFLTLRSTPAVVSTTAARPTKARNITQLSPSFGDHTTSLFVGGTF